METYPYFLPCFTASLLSIAGIISGYFFLPETCRSLLPARDQDDEYLDSVENIEDGILTAENSFRSDEFDEMSEATPLLEENQKKHAQKISSKSICITIAYSILSFQDIIFSELFPLWAVAQTPQGLGWTAKDIGACLSIIGVISIICQIVLYPKFSQCFSPLSLYSVPMIGYLLVYTGLPLIPKLISSESTSLTWFCTILLLGLKNITGNFVFTSVMILVSNSASKDNLGYINGIAQAGAALARTMGPIVGGTIWAWSNENRYSFPFDYNFIFVVLSATVILMVIQARVML